MISHPLFCSFVKRPLDDRVMAHIISKVGEIIHFGSWKVVKCWRTNLMASASVQNSELDSISIIYERLMKLGPFQMHINLQQAFNAVWKATCILLQPNAIRLRYAHSFISQGKMFFYRGTSSHLPLISQILKPQPETSESYSGTLLAREDNGPKWWVLNKRSAFIITFRNSHWLIKSLAAHAILLSKL